jgi:hypothetical protein
MATPLHMKSLPATLKLHIPPQQTSVARDVVEEGKAAQNLEVFGQMPLINNGPLIQLVLVQKAQVLTLIVHQFLSNSFDLAGAIQIKRIQQPVGRYNDTGHQFRAEGIPLVLVCLSARFQQMCKLGDLFVIFTL